MRDERERHSKMDGARNLKHELRTPVNHIVGYSGLLLESAQDATDDVSQQQVVMLQSLAAELNVVVEGILLQSHGVLNQADIETIANALFSLRSQVEQTRVQIAGSALDESMASDLDKIRGAVQRLQSLLEGSFAVAAYPAGKPDAP